MIFVGRGQLGVAVHRKDPSHPGKYIINLKLTKYSLWKSSGRLVFDLGRRLELTVIALKIQEILKNPLATRDIDQSASLIYFRYSYTKSKDLKIGFL